MTARVAGFVTRDQAGLDPPRSRSFHVHPDRGGAAVHYGGGAQSIGDHSECLSRWRAWQRFHMRTKGWTDIAYNAGFCDHGYALAGRGFGVRSGAQGTNDGNDRFMAFVWIGGAGETPTREAVDALEWLILRFREKGMGTEVRPHSYFKTTGCPGDPLRSDAARLHRTAISETDDDPAGSGETGETDDFKEKVMGLPTLRRGMGGPDAPVREQQLCRNVQAFLIAHSEGDVRADPYTQQVGVDGWVDAGEDGGGFGPATERVLIKWQERTGYLAKHERGEVGPKTWAWFVGV